MKPIKVALAGAGAFGIKHLDGIKNIDGVEVVSLISRDLGKTQEVAAKYGIGHVTTDLADSLALPEVDAVILCTPTQMHASQTLACLKAGKHVQVEIPLCDVLKEKSCASPKKKAWWPCAVTPVASTPATNGCTTKSRRANSTSSKWMCKPTSFAAPT